MPGKPRFGRSAGNLKSLSTKRSQKIQKGNSWASKEPQRKKQNYRPTPPCSFVVFLVTAVPPAEASRLGTLTLLRAAGRPSEAFILLWHHTGHHMTLVSSVQQCRGLWEEGQTFCATRHTCQLLYSRQPLPHCMCFKESGDLFESWGVTKVIDKLNLIIWSMPTFHVSLQIGWGLIWWWLSSIIQRLLFYLSLTNTWMLIFLITMWMH